MKNNFKKLISVFMTATVLGSCTVCVNASDASVPDLTGPARNWSLLYSQTFENEEDTTFSTSKSATDYGTVNTTVSREQIDGTYATHIKGSNTSTTEGHETYSWSTSSKTLGTVNDATIGIDNGCVAQFDVYKVSDGLPITAYWRSKYLNITHAVGLPTSNFPESNRWYTVTIESSGTYWRDNNSAGKVFVSVKDNVTGVVVSGTYFASYIPYNSASCFGFICDARVAGNTKMADFDDLCYITGTGTALENAAATDYYIDNVKLYNRTAVTTTGVNLYEDWDSFIGEGTHSAASTTSTIVSEADGNTYRTMEAASDANQLVKFVANGDDLEMSNEDFTVSLDVVKLADNGDSLFVGYNSGVDNPSGTDVTYSYGFAIPACTVTKDVWYSYRIVSKEGVMTAYCKTRDGEDPFVEVGVKAVPNNTKYSVTWGTATPVLYAGGSYSSSITHKNSILLYLYKSNVKSRLAYGADGTEVFRAVTGTKWGYDNLVVTEGKAMMVESINVGTDADNRATKVTFKTADAVTDVLPVIGYYDANNRLVFVDFDSNATYDSTDIKSSWYLTSRSSDGVETDENYLGTIGSGGYAKAFLWNTSDGIIPAVEAVDVTSIVK